MAGARTVVSSLWNVGDESTARLMASFYRHLWVEGASKSEALRSAQLERLAANRRSHGEDLPRTWGAFVLSGHWD
jgi:CHAT domain-containing protein